LPLFCCGEPERESPAILAAWGCPASTCRGWRAFGFRTFSYAFGFDLLIRSHTSMAAVAASWAWVRMPRTLPCLVSAFGRTTDHAHWSGADVAWIVYAIPLCCMGAPKRSPCAPGSDSEALALFGLAILT
jgi:hypothetical protein